VFHKYSVKYVSPWELARQRVATTVHNITSPFVAPINAAQSTAFVVGCGHSGTTLTASRLGNHADVYVVGYETYAFKPLNGLYCSKQIAEGWLVAAGQVNKNMVIEKTPKHVHCADRIWRIFPGARIIGIVRNPLDNCSSLKERFGSIEYAVWRWIEDNRALYRIAAESRVKLVTYEELTRDPEAVLSDICKFLGLRWDSRILSVGETAYANALNTGVKALREAQVSSPITSKSKRCLKNMNENEVAYVNTSTKKIARAFGYA